MAEQAIGVVGLATMGMNLARNLASHGASVAVYNRTRTRTDEFMSAYAGDGDFHSAFTLEELTKALRPRVPGHGRLRRGGGRVARTQPHAGWAARVVRQGRRLAQGDLGQGGRR